VRLRPYLLRAALILLPIAAAAPAQRKAPREILTGGDGMLYVGE